MRTENLLWCNHIHLNYWVPNFKLNVRFGAFYERSDVGTSLIILQAPDNVCSNHNPDNYSAADLTIYGFCMICSATQSTSYIKSIISLSLFGFHLANNKMNFASLLCDQLHLLRFLFINQFSFDQVQE